MANDLFSKLNVLMQSRLKGVLGDLPPLRFGGGDELDQQLRHLQQRERDLHEKQRRLDDAMVALDRQVDVAVQAGREADARALLLQIRDKQEQAAILDEAIRDIHQAIDEILRLKGSMRDRQAAAPAVDHPEAQQGEPIQIPLVVEGEETEVAEALGDEAAEPAADHEMMERLSRLSRPE
jgi:Lhr-like helicase